MTIVAARGEDHQKDISTNTKLILSTMAVKSPTVMTQLSSQVETDVAPITPQNFFANRPQFPSHQGSLSVDAMAGPRGKLQKDNAIFYVLT